MGIKCPKCQFDNTDTARFCSNCATTLPSQEVSVTKTLETPTRRLALGSIFAERYEILEELGKGGMGEVYKVRDKTLDEEMALKVLKPEIAADKDIIERFKNELKFARKIAHRHVCKMFDLSEEEETPYITMEYVKGEDLKSFIRKKEKLKEEEVIVIAKQVCEGLAEAHRLGVVHRDLKPQNIMIDKDGDTKVMDFGIARSVEAPGVTQSGVMIGTPDYMSPEQAEGEEADQRSDIYALGVILYEMVTGSVPFKGDTAFSVALKHKSKLPSDPRKLNPDISDDLSRLILICMEKERERRYQTAEALLADLRNIEDGLPLGTEIRPRRETLLATIVRKKLLIPAVVVALVIMAFIIWQLLPQKAPTPIPSDRPSLAVVYFENNTGDDSLDHWRKMLPDMLITDLSQSKHLRVLSGERIYEILRELNQVEARTYGLDVLQKIAEKGRVDHLLLGKYAKLGETFRIDIQLLEASTGEILASERADASGENEVFPKVDELTPKIKANLNLTEEQIATDIDENIGKITTSSPEAYRYFVKGLKNNFEGDNRKAIEFYKKAVAVDSEFARAYVEMGISHRVLGMVSEGRKYIQRALELSDRVSDKERYFIEGQFYRDSERTYDKAIEAFNKILEIYPEDIDAINALGAVYMRTEQWDKAIEVTKVSIRNKTPIIYDYFIQARAYRAKGLYDKAVEVLNKYITAFSDHGMIHRALATNYLCQGKYDLALVENEKAIALNPDYYWNHMFKGYIHLSKEDFVNAELEFQKGLNTDNIIYKSLGALSMAFLNITQGRFEDSINQFRKGIELSKKLGDKFWEYLFRFRLAYRYLQSGHYEKALKECEESRKAAMEIDNLLAQENTLVLKGLIHLEMKSISDAQQVADELKDFLKDDINKKSIRFYYFLMGMIELKKEDFSEAVKFFNDAFSLVPFQREWNTDKHALFINPLAFAYYKSGNFEKAIEEYEKITSLTTGRFQYGDIYTKSFYMLGKIFEQKGWKGKAIEHYQKFLSLWKDADSSIAEVEDTRKRLTGLKR